MSLPKLGPKLGPFPAGIWVLIIGAGLYVGHRHRAAATATATTSTSDTTASTDTTAATDTTATSDVPFGVSTDVPLDFGTAGSGGTSISSSGVTASTGPTSSDLLDNGSWRVAALKALIAAGVNPITAEMAVAHYLNGDALTTTEADAINRAERLVGPPPEGIDAPTVIGNPPALHPIATLPAGPSVPTATQLHRVHRMPATKRAHRKPPKPAAAHTYTVRPGDTLSAIAARLHVPGGWPALYDANHAAIESAAKRHGKASSSGGHWIFPGTALRIPA